MVDGEPAHIAPPISTPQPTALGIRFEYGEDLVSARVQGRGVVRPYRHRPFPAPAQVPPGHPSSLVGVVHHQHERGPAPAPLLLGHPDPVAGMEDQRWLCQTIEKPRWKGGPYPYPRARRESEFSCHVSRIRPRRLGLSRRRGAVRSVERGDSTEPHHPLREVREVSQVAPARGL